MRQQPSKALGLVLVFILEDSFGTVWSCGDLSGDILCLSVCHSFGRLYPRWRAKHAAPRGFTKLPPKRQGPALTTVRKIADQPSNPNRPGVRGECGTDQPTLGRRVLANLEKRAARPPFFPNLREASNLITRTAAKRYCTYIPLQEECLSTQLGCMCSPACFRAFTRR